MALNWAMVDADQKPVPLPEEKIWLSVDKCQMSLEFREPTVTKWDAKGSVYVTNQRVVFLRQPPLPPPADQSQTSHHLRSLNVPLTHLVDSRYLIPIFGAPYYEAAVLPVPGGNLPQSRQGGPTVKGLLKIWFNEGGGSAFREAVEEVRNLAKGGQHGEQLPLYQPPHTPGTSGAPSVAATANSSLESRTVAGDHSERSSVAGTSYIAGRPSSRASQLSSTDLDAARVAHQEEEAEREAIRQRAESNAAAPGIEATQAIAASQSQQRSTHMEEDDEPPAYAMVSPVTTYVRAQAVESSGSRKSMSSSRVEELKVALRKVIGSHEGKDRILQLCVGVALLAHHSFGSVRHPHSYGIYPIPHFLFLLFPRPIRREALTGMRQTGEAAESARRLLLLAKWAQDLACKVRPERNRDAEKIPTQGRESSDVDGARTDRISTRRDQTQHQPKDAHGLELLIMEDESHMLSSWQERLASFGHTLALCAGAADIASFLGGSAVVWKVLSGDWFQRRKNLLAYRQRRLLDKTALSLGIMTLIIHVYIISALRRRARRALGRLHRRLLLLTDDLADAQKEERERRRNILESKGDASLPRLYSTKTDVVDIPRRSSASSSPSSSPSSSSSSSSSTSSECTVSATQATLKHRNSTSVLPHHPHRQHQQYEPDRNHHLLLPPPPSDLASIRTHLSTTDSHFQSTRHRLSQLNWEMSTTLCEVSCAIIAAFMWNSGGNDTTRRRNVVQGWLAWLSIAAGATGLVKIAREE